MKTLTIGTIGSKPFSLPNDKGKAATEAFAFLGRRGSGKTYAATKFAELLFESGEQFVAIDPVGIWYGLRLGANGKSPGLDVKIFGGLHGDIMLLPTAGALIADVVVDRGISVVIDVSQFETDADKAKFATDFGARFFHRKSQQPSPVHVFIEEAQEIIPQNIQRGEERMLHVWQRMIRLGRNHGIGVTMISQRPQDVNKKALNQAECIFAFQLTGPQERKAVAGWISEKGLDDNLADLLPSLKQGHAHVWSPVWLDVNEEVKIGTKQTFAAGSTPTSDSKPIEVKPLAPDDLDKLVQSMGKAQEQIKANDPRELKRQVAELQKQLTAKQKPVTASVTVDQKSIDRAIAARDKFWQGEMAKARKSFEQIQVKVMNAETAIALALGIKWPSACELPKVEAPVTLGRGDEREMVLPASTVARIMTPRLRLEGDTGVRISAGLREILIHLAQNPNGLSAQKIGARTGIDTKLSTFRAHMADARKSNWIEGDRYCLRITGEGLDALGLYDPLPTDPQSLQTYWLTNKKLSGGAKAILEQCIRAYPNEVPRDDAARAANTDPNISTFRAYLAELRNYDLIGKNIRASDNLFD